MEPNPTAEHAPADAAVRLVTGLAWTCIVLMTPFAVNNLFRGRVLLGLGACTIVGVFVLNLWAIHRHGYFYRTAMTAVLIPMTVTFLILSIKTQGMIGVLWCFPGVLAFYLMLPERVAWAGNAVLVIVTSALAAQIVEPALTIRIAATLSMVSIFSAIFVNVIGQQQASLLDMAETDSLTGLRNRKSLLENVDGAIYDHSRNGLPVSLVALDVDHFKTINDEFGHDRGDVVLRALGELLRNRCRKGDAVFRLGGEEFLVVLRGADHASAVRVAEDLRRRIVALDILPGRTITASFGVAALRAGDTAAAWMKRADVNLYAAKDAGRNCVNAPLFEAMAS